MPVTKIKTKWTSGNLVFTDNDGTALMTIESDGTFNVANAGKLEVGGVGIDATPAELNTVNDESLAATDGLQRFHMARATYDFSSEGGAVSAIGLGVTLPDNAIICGGFVDVSTTCTSATDAGTMALKIATANDLVVAVAIDDQSNPWDAGVQAIIPKANTPESTSIKLTTASEITATIAVEAFTAGKFTVNLLYHVGD